MSDYNGARLVQQREFTQVAVPGDDKYSDPDSEELEGTPEEIDIAEDVYGATVYSVIHDGYDLFTGKDHDKMTAGINFTRFIFCIFSLVVNYILQIGLLWFSYFFVASPAVGRVQNIYKAYHRDCFSPDLTKVPIQWNFNQTMWDAWPEDKRHQLCNMVYSNFFFLYCILCLWWMTILNEFRSNERMLRNFCSIRAVDDQMIEHAEDPEDTTEKVVGFVLPVRFLLYVFLIVPKFLIGIVLLILGTMWLTATEDFADLVLNAVALEFIIQVDETIFTAMFPAGVKKNIGNMKLLLRKALQTPETMSKELWDGICRSWAYYLLIFIAVYLYLQFGQRLPYIGVLPGYADDAACPKWWAERAQRPCGIWNPLSGGDCFPYGSNSSLEL